MKVRVKYHGKWINVVVIHENDVLVYKNHICICGCNQNIPVTKNNLKIGIPDYSHGHNNAFKNGNKVGNRFKTGDSVKYGVEFKKGNKWRYKNGHKVSKKLRKIISKEHKGKKPKSFIDGYSQERGSAIHNSLRRGYPIPVFMNFPFPGCSFHHLTEEIGIFIPKEIHKSIWHRLEDSVSMKRVNKFVNKWMMKSF